LIFLNRWSIYFFPERPDVIAQMHQLALELGGMIEKPTLSKKYRWIQKIFGWKVAKRAQFALPVVRQVFQKVSEQLSLK
jgi:hypothetical protein